MANRNYNRSNQTNQNLSQSAVIDLRARNIGVEDLEVASLVCRYARESDKVFGRQLGIAIGMANALGVAITLVRQGNHQAAAKKTSTCLYVLNRNEQVAKLRIRCRDNQIRSVKDVVQWFSNTHFRINDQIEESQLEEAQLAEAAAVRENAEPNEGLDIKAA
jgi:hypothetical protein